MERGRLKKGQGDVRERERQRETGLKGEVVSGKRGMMRRSADGGRDILML